MGGAGCWNRLTRLRPDGGVARVRMHNAANG
ncbi:sgbE domain protein, partial [Shigella flexneri 1235-66]